MISLSPDNNLEEVVVVGYGAQKKASIIGSIASVPVNDIKMPTGKISNNLAGQLAGVISVQRSGEPGASSTFWIRGISTFGSNKSPLVLVDGIERDLDLVDIEDIKEFSILKDAAATAVYGVRGANGVVLVTTRGGIVGKPQINIKFEAGMVQPTKIPGMIDAVQFAEMYNAAAGYDFYSKKDIQMFRDGSDPDLHPNIDWVDRLYKDYSFNQRVNVNISGGGSTAKYYISGGFYNEAAFPGRQHEGVQHVGLLPWVLPVERRGPAPQNTHQAQRQSIPRSNARTNRVRRHRRQTASGAMRSRPQPTPSRTSIRTATWPARRRDRARTPMRC